MKLDLILADYLDWLRVRHYSAHTLDGRQRSLRRFFAYLQTNGVADLREVTRQTIEDYVRQSLDELASTTVRFHLECVRSFFEHLEANDVILLNPADRVPSPRMESRLPRYILKPEEVRRMLDAPDTTMPTGIRDRAILELIYSSGIRRQEIGRLTLPDVDLKNGFVRITCGKGGKDRVVPIGESACETLARYLREARRVWLQGHPVPTNALWLTAVHPHHPVEITAIPRIIERYALRVLGKKVPPHVWRHTCATHLVANGADVAYVQRLLGHKWLTTTQIYTRVGVPDLKKTLQAAHPAMQQAAPPPLTREAAAHMHSGHKQARPKNP